VVCFGVWVLLEWFWRANREYDRLALLCPIYSLDTKDPDNVIATLLPPTAADLNERLKQMQFESRQAKSNSTARNTRHATLMTAYHAKKDIFDSEVRSLEAMEVELDDAEQTMKRFQNILENANDEVVAYIAAAKVVTAQTTITEGKIRLQEAKTKVETASITAEKAQDAEAAAKTVCIQSNQTVQDLEQSAADLKFSIEQRPANFDEDAVKNWKTGVTIVLEDESGTTSETVPIEDMIGSDRFLRDRCYSLPPHYVKTFAHTSLVIFRFSPCPVFVLPFVNCFSVLFP
jgi:predicted  nucleic acid-binding Zn-ribbon protein